MNKFKEFLSNLSTGMLAGITVWMLIAPYPVAPEPHLVEKFKMLAAGTLSKPIDIFDIFWHLLPATLLVLKLSWAKQSAEKDSH